MTREEAINELNEELMGINPNALGREKIERWAVALNMAIEALKEERPHGEWGKWIISEVRCPECLEYFDAVWFSKEDMNNCPSCGKKMIGGEKK